MDDYFSGLITPHINEMRLEEVDNTDNNKEEKIEALEAVADILIEKEETLDSPQTGDISHQSISTTSSSTSSTSSSSHKYVSLRDYQPPHVTYDRDNPLQSLVAVIGREFDEPQSIVSKLQSLVPIATDHTPLLKLIPFTVRRSILIKANFDWEELKSLDLVCMCYNASEARILLTGPDGFYTQLIKRLESILGTNKIAFLVTNYLTEIDFSTSLIINNDLRTRLTAQTSLIKYLDTDQVMSWFKEPCDSHMTKLIELAQSERNPSNSCVIL